MQISSGFPIRSVAAFVLTVGLLFGQPSLALAQSASVAADVFSASSIELVPVDGATIEWRGRTYPGTMQIKPGGGGLVLISELEPEAYLEGIREVPTEWPMESLKAQIVAARTYLAWTLARGRVGSARSYGFDICATTACQVYAGGGDERWAEAIAATTGEILVYDGSPAQALYSSTSGGRTRTVGDVFVGSSNLPYLQAVESADEDSPFVDWAFSLTHDQMQAILIEAGLSGDFLIDVDVVESPDGEGPWMVEVLSSAGVRSMNSWRFRSTLNRWAPRLYPDDFPALRPDGRRYPQVMLSPSFGVTRTATPVDLHADGNQEPYTIEFVIEGNGWGHLVGMSQYGAKARADAGDTYDGILSHFYGGLLPTQFPLPETVTVGLGWGIDDIEFNTGPVDVYADGQLIASEVAGEWHFDPADGAVSVSPPPSWNVPAGLGASAMPVDGSAAVVSVSGFARGPGEAQLIIFDGNTVVFKSEWQRVVAGPVRLFWSPDRFGQLRVVGQVRFDDGSSGILNSALSAR